MCYYVVAENGAVVCTYGLLDTAAVSSLITSHLAERLQLQGTPEKVSINTVTQKNHACELAKVKFLVRPTGQDGPCFPVCHALAVESLNVSDQYSPDHLDLSEWPHLKDLEFPNVPVDMNEVSVLIGQDVPQAHSIGLLLGRQSSESTICNEDPIWMVCGWANNKKGR